jgi:threonine dehydratase
VKIIGVESSGAPGMHDSVRTGSVVTLDKVDCIIDGLRVKRVGDTTFEVVRRYVDEIVTLPDSRIFDAMIWIMTHAKLVVEGAAAAPVGALLDGLVKAPSGSKVVCVLSGGNVDLEQLRGLRWN